LQPVEEFDGAVHLKSPWTTPQGVGKCRNMGAWHANTDNLIFLDAHMDFDPGWLDVILETLESNENAVVCSKSVKIEPPLGMKRKGKLNAGAVIRRLGTGTGRPLEVEWLDSPIEPGEIQCCLGACYGITSKRYHELGRPWANAFGWGTSEQTLCMVNSLCGGVNILADCETGHYYMDSRNRGFKPDSDFKMGALFNRLRLIRMVYGDDADKMLRIDIARSKYRPYAEEALKILHNTDDSHITELFKQNIEEYAKKWWKEEEKPQITPKKLITPHQTPADERFV
jgi:hypothetical protein